MDEQLFLAPGTMLDGSYKIIRVVGAGGFGITYEAEDINLGTTVAIKEFFPSAFASRTHAFEVRPVSPNQSATFEWGRASFLQEAKTLAKFRHPCIVRVFRVFEANATAYMVMVRASQSDSLKPRRRSVARLIRRDPYCRVLGKCSRTSSKMARLVRYVPRWWSSPPVSLRLARQKTSPSDFR